MKKVLIFVDTREFGSRVVSCLGAYNCIIKKKLLLIGDYLVSDRVCIELKKAADFVQSIVDHRLFEQLAALKENFERPVLLIEGESLYGRLPVNVIRGALAAIAIDFAVPLIWTQSEEESAGIIYWIARREQLEAKREITVREKKPTSLAEQQEFLISGLPGISAVRARALLRHFKSPAAVLLASELELQQIEGIGKKIAKKIKEILEKEYK
jgi:Fanconi anemia group M protein